MELFNFFHLFSFLPVIIIGGIFWFERMYRHGAQKRTLYLFFSLLIIALVGILHTLAWTFKTSVPLMWPQLYVLSGVLYYLAFIALEYAIHVKRIDESFLTHDFFKHLQQTTVWFIVTGGVVVAILTYYGAFNWDHQNIPLSLFLNEEAKKNGAMAYEGHMHIMTVIFTILIGALCVISARKIFNLQEGVIRKREYPFYFQILVMIIVLAVQFIQPGATEVPADGSHFLPLPWFSILNVIFVVRLVEEFFFWSQYNLRSDRNKLEQRQHTQNLLIRRVISSPEDEDKFIIRETMENALEKIKPRMVVAEYNVTGMAVYRAVGNVLRIEDARHIIGYCTPLADIKTLKNLDKQKLGEQVLRTTYDIRELRETMTDNIKDFGKKLIKTAMTQKQIEVLAEMPESLRGLQRLVVVVPIFDANNFMGFVAVFKDSFDKLYPAEREILSELGENLGTIFALVNAKDAQRERNRLQGEMDTARNIQTSILPKKVQVPGFTIGTYMETASEVGGDVFDFLPSPFGTYFGIGDVAGHGLPAGMMAVISVAALHGAVEASKVLNKELPLDQVYDIVNRVLCTLNRDRIGSDKFMTQNYFLEKDGKISHVGTHLVALLYHKSSDQIEELTGLTDRTGFLGLSEFVVSSQSLGSFNMKTGDILVLYSDGVIEAKNVNGSMFQLDGIKNALREHIEKTPDELIQAILEDLRRFATTGDLKKHGGHFTDDVSLVILKRE